MNWRPANKIIYDRIGELGFLMIYIRSRIPSEQEKKRDKIPDDVSRLAEGYMFVWSSSKEIRIEKGEFNYSPNIINRGREISK